MVPGHKVTLCQPTGQGSFIGQERLRRPLVTFFLQPLLLIPEPADELLNRALLAGEVLDPAVDLFDGSGGILDIQLAEKLALLIRRGRLLTGGG